MSKTWSNTPHWLCQWPRKIPRIRGSSYRQVNRLKKSSVRSPLIFSPDDSLSHHKSSYHSSHCIAQAPPHEMPAHDLNRNVQLDEQNISQVTAALMHATPPILLADHLPLVRRKAKDLLLRMLTTNSCRLTWRVAFEARKWKRTVMLCNCGWTATP